jgi:hypothetical protein
MCEPISITMGIMSAVGTIASTMEAQKAADAKVKAQERMGKNAIIGAQHEQNSLRIKQGQEKRASAAEEQRSDSAAERAKAGAAAAAAEGNVSGASVDSLLQSYDAENGRYKSATQKQQSFKDVGTELALQGTDIQLTQNLEAYSTPVAGPSYLAAAANIGASSASAYGSGMDRVAARET